MWSKRTKVPLNSAFLYLLFVLSSGGVYSVYIWFKSATDSVSFVLFCGQTCQMLFTIYRTPGAQLVLSVSYETLLRPLYLLTVCLSKQNPTLLRNVLFFTFQMSLTDVSKLVFVIFTLSLRNNTELGDRGGQWRTWADVLFPNASDCRAVGGLAPILIRGWHGDYKGRY